MRFPTALSTVFHRLAPAVCVGLAAACAHDTAGLTPGGRYPATLRLVPVLPGRTAAERASSQQVDSINVAITNAAGDTLGFSGVAFPLGQDSVVVRVTVVLDSATQTVTAHVDVLAGGQVVYRQVLQVQASVTSQVSAAGDSVPLVSAVWRQVAAQAQSALPGRVGLATVYDTGQKEIVAFGGAGTAGALGETWVLGGGHWSQLTIAGPSARVGHGMVFDAGRNVAVLFGGAAASGFVNDTWEFNAATKTWTQVTTTGTPSPRGAFVMAYDAGRGVVVLFGGYGAGGFLNETWEYNGATRTWTQVATAAAPTPRAGSGLAYDAALGKSVLFGGLDANLDALNDTWTYDGANWTQVCAACAPPVRAALGMAYDPAGRVLLFGGANSHVDVSAVTSNTGVDTVRHNDLWAFDGTTWTELAADNPAAGPSKRAGMGVSFDPQRSALVVVSGLSALALESDTWTWTGSWAATATAPLTARSQQAVALDTRRGVAIMYGGTGADTVTWLYDGLAWRPAAFAGPGARVAPAMAYDQGRGLVVLFGGSRSGAPLPDTWVFDGTSWTNLSTTGAPPARSGAAMVYDSLLGRIVMFGGQGASAALNDTWEYSTATATWTQVSTSAAPPARSGAAVTYDPVRAKVVLFGGGGGLADTWTFDGTAWSQVTTAHAPAGRSGAALAYEYARGQSVLFGGVAAGVGQNDLWVFNGTDWTQLYPVAAPSPRSGASMASWVGGSLLLFGGSTAAGDAADTWIFN